MQPGVVTAKFVAAVEAKGLFYPPDPGSQAANPPLQKVLPTFQWVDLQHK